jgi:hypothetical protein
VLEEVTAHTEVVGRGEGIFGLAICEDEGREGGGGDGSDRNSVWSSEVTPVLVEDEVGIIVSSSLGCSCLLLGFTKSHKFAAGGRRDRFGLCVHEVCIGVTHDRPTREGNSFEGCFGRAAYTWTSRFLTLGSG